jgi:hypothetical protein
MSQTKMGKAIVARGRTVCVPTGNRVQVGLTQDGQQVLSSETRDFGPGEEVTLPIDEIARLRETGHLVDPDRAPLNYGEGPAFNRDTSQVGMQHGGVRI